MYSFQLKQCLSISFSIFIKRKGLPAHTTRDLARVRAVLKTYRLHGVLVRFVDIPSVVRGSAVLKNTASNSRPEYVILKLTA